MRSNVTYWLLVIEKYWYQGKTDEVVKCLCSLCANLKDKTVSPDQKISIIRRLKDLLLSGNTKVLQCTLSLICVLLDDSELPSEITLTLMEQAASMLHFSGDNLSLVCEMLSYLTNEKTTQMLRSSGCLQSILSIFSDIDLCDTPLDKINWLVNIIICATSAETRLIIGEEVIPKVVNFLNIWLNIDDPDCDMSTTLKELLFLCRCVISCSKEGQHVFLETGGLESLISALKKTDVMEESFRIIVPTRRCLHIDYSPTLFSSLVILLDVAVTHNNEACQRAVDLNATGILKHYLDMEADGKWQVEQRVYVVETIGHLLESDLKIPSPSLLNKMYYMVKETGCSIDVLSYLQNKLRFEKNSRKCTPHPKKKRLSLKKNLAPGSLNYFQDHANVASPSNQEVQKVEKIYTIKGTPHPNKNVHSKKPLKRLSPGYELKPKIIDSSSNKKCQVSTHAIEANLCPESNCLQVAPLLAPQSTSGSTKPRKYFFSQAELLLFMHCVQVHGVNMQNVRHVFPFHKELTPFDLYTLWRALWPYGP